MQDFGRVVASHTHQGHAFAFGQESPFGPWPGGGSPLEVNWATFHVIDREVMKQCRRNIMSVTCQSHQWTKRSWVNDRRQNAHPVNDINESVPNSAAALNLFCNIPPFASISSNGQASGDDQRRTEIQKWQVQRQVRSQSMTKSWITVNDNLNDKTKHCPWQVQTMSMASSLIVSEG